jgi:hypothetical protein
MTITTEYANIDFDLKSNTPFDALRIELSKSCNVLQYMKGDDGRWHAIVEAGHDDDSHDRNAAMDILSLLQALSTLSQTNEVGTGRLLSPLAQHRIRMRRFLGLRPSASAGHCSFRRRRIVLTGGHVVSHAKCRQIAENVAG